MSLIDRITWLTSLAQRHLSMAEVRRFEGSAAKYHVARAFRAMEQARKLKERIA